MIMIMITIIYSYLWLFIIYRTSCCVSSSTGQSGTVRARDIIRLVKLNSSSNTKTGTRTKQAMRPDEQVDV